jgi:putative Mg2+ transporter-C (MgtC) family protein
MVFTPDDLLRLALATLLGGLIGIEREFRDKAAGFRTLIFICLGAALFTMLSAKLTTSTDPNRIAAQIVSGVGFLGAGVILRDGGRVLGLTTASTVWLTAAVGMAVGGGQYLLAGASVIVASVVLWAFPRIEQWIDNIREERTYEVVCSLKPDKLMTVERMLRQSGLHIRSHRQLKTGDSITISLQASGSPQAHERATAQLFADPEIKEFKF